jgi:hypothetical protein
VRTIGIQGVLRSCPPSPRSSPGVCSAAATAAHRRRAPQDWLGVCRIGTVELRQVWALCAFLHAPHVKRRGSTGVRGGAEVPAHRCVHTQCGARSRHTPNTHTLHQFHIPCARQPPPPTHTHTQTHTLVCAGGAEDRVAKSLAYIGEQRIVDRSVADRGESARVRECESVCRRSLERDSARVREREREVGGGEKGSARGMVWGGH